MAPIIFTPELHRLGPLGRGPRPECSSERSRSDRNSCPGFQGALGEVDLLPATLAEMFLVKLIGENFRFFAAIGAFADKRLQVPHLFKSRAMLGCGHKLLL